MSDLSKSSRPVSVPAHRLTRLARFGALAAGVAGNVAGQSLAQLGQGRRPASMQRMLLTPSNIQRITSELARMRGAAMKMGQLLSMDTGDVLPPELAQIMSRLRADADFMPPKQLKQVLSDNWPSDWLRHFQHFNVRPIAAASIGQVHRAQLKDGRDVAIKVQYPGVAKSIDSDVANVATLIRLSGLVPKGFDFDPYIEEARKQLHAETDYVQEAAHLNAFSDLMKGAQGFDIPEFYADWSTQQILTMRYVDSVPLEHLRDADQSKRNALAARLITLVLREMFEFGVMQTDPNYANYRYAPATDDIILLDFGATRHLSADIVDAYRDLFRAGFAGDQAGMSKAIERMGIMNAATAEMHRAQIVDMATMVFDTVRSRGMYDFADVTLSRQMQAKGITLAESGYVPPPVPMDVPFLQRKLAGVFLIAADLKAEINVQELFAAHLK